MDNGRWVDLTLRSQTSVRSGPPAIERREPVRHHVAVRSDRGPITEIGVLLERFPGVRARFVQA